MCWFGGLGVENKKVLERVVNICSKVVGEKQMSVNGLYERRVKKKALSVCGDKSHVLSKYYDMLPSGRRYRVPKAKTLRFRNSFIPRSVHFLNMNFKAN